MKISHIIRLLSFIVITLLSQPANSQYYILGRGLDEEEQPYSFAKAELHGEGASREQTTSELGVFRFEDLKSGSYELVLITPYGIRRKKVELRGSIDITLHIPRNIEMDEISVVARRAASHEPVTHDNITSEELEQKNTGQDLPYLLQGSPSLVVTSDAGHGVGYTGLRIRGTDPTRINVTLNGIPVNDAESHNVFWVDLPDIAGSTSNIQIQRGIGWSQPGAGDLGGGIHLNTLAFNHEPFGKISLGAGSFGTQKASLQGGTGLINGRFTFDGRGTYIRSDGFIERAESQLYSAYASVGYHHDDINIRLVYALGDELTYQAWNGVPVQYINDSQLRTFNSAGTEKSVTDPYDNEVDDYTQSYYQLHYDHAVTPFARWTNAIFLTTGKGFFEQYKADQLLSDYGLDSAPPVTDLVRRRWLDNRFYGFTSSVQIGKPLERYLIFGGGWNKYEGEHFGNVIWTQPFGDFFSPHTYYFNDAVKRDWNLFGRSHIKLTDKLDAILDLQQRWIKYSFEGPDETGTATDQEVNHSFFNPKAGFQYSLSASSSFYALTGIIHKEPNRDDYVNSTPQSRPLPERLWDTEVGYRLTLKKLAAELTGYYMSYDDQLVLTGRLNDVGAYTRINVMESYRLGTEASLTYTPLEKLSLTGHMTLSRNTIKAFDEYIDNWDSGVQEVVGHSNTDIAFSPSVLAGLQGDYAIVSGKAHEIKINLGGHYVGEQYLDNTSRKESLLEEYFVADAGLQWTWNSLWAKQVNLRFFVKNLFNHSYESNGWIYRFRSPSYDPTPDDPYAGKEGDQLYHLKGYFPQAGRHFFLTLEVEF